MGWLSQLCDKSARGDEAGVKRDRDGSKTGQKRDRDIREGRVVVAIGDRKRVLIM